MKTVLIVGGRKDDVETVRIEQFETRRTAHEYCEELNEKWKDEKYWYTAKIIHPSQQYDLRNFITQRYDY